jgi:hypothetical protein
MAGQPPDPSFPPSGHEQDQGLTQGRPAWPSGYDQQPGTPPPASGGTGAGGGRAYAAPPPGYAQEQGYGGGHDQTFAAQPAPAYGEPDQAEPGYVPGYQAPGRAGQYQSGGYSAADAGRATGTPPPGWQAGPGTGAQQGTRSSDRGEKGFLGSLFDFSFSSFVTPKIIKVLYVLFTIWTALVALIITVIGFRTGGMPGGLFTLIVIVPIFVLLTLGIYRVVLEAFMVVFRIYEETKKLREASDRASLS